MRRQRAGSAAAAPRQRGGKDNLAPAEDLHNKNPSLAALGKNGWILRPQENSKTLESRIAVFLKPLGASGVAPWGPWASLVAQFGPLAQVPWGFLGPRPMGSGPGPKTLIFLSKMQVFYAAAAPRQRGGKDNLAPAEDVHNKNPSLVALGKMKDPRTR